MRLDLESVRKNVQGASTEDLLDRATVFRGGMEAEALEIIDAELQTRGYTALDLEYHSQKRGPKVVIRSDGTAARCSFCLKPATSKGWGWHAVWGRFPLWPRFLHYCEEHRPGAGDELAISS
ncbi:hypothetical protein BH10PLA2_BH10PLA2_12670 [soil metagenome]